jgi:hypothetical protein
MRIQPLGITFLTALASTACGAGQSTRNGALHITDSMSNCKGPVTGEERTENG